MAKRMNLPIVFQALPKWDAPYNSTSLTIAKLLSRKRMVFYVEHPFSYRDEFRSKERSRINYRKQKEVEQPFESYPDFYVIHPPLILPFNRLNEGMIYNKMLSAYLKQLWARIDRILGVFNISEFGYVNSFDPVYFDVKSTKNCVYKLYHCVDLIEGERYIAKHGVQAERKAVDSADQVIVTSEPLKHRFLGAKAPVNCIKNASDFKHFLKPQSEPEEYRGIQQTKIVYTGSLGHRIDYHLVEQLAKEYPEYEIFLIGPKHSTYFDGENLSKYKNVHFTGPKSYSELPAYIQHADLLFIPFLKNELTHHIYPLKINEYLSSGKPVLTTAFTNLDEFEGLLTVINSPNDLSAKLEEALTVESKNKDAERIEFASLNTWEHRIEEWEQILGKVTP